MPSQKPTASDAIKALETIGAAAVCVGAVILCITNPKVRQQLKEALKDDPKDPDSAKAPAPIPGPPRTASGAPVTGGEGVVYLLKAGPFFKIGKAQGFDKRYRQIKLQLPFPTEALHQIECDDISHVERYWHKRFTSKRQNGEWFTLSETDVAEFKAQTKM